MYLGEARIYKDRVEEFFDIAKDLQIKELITDSPTEEYCDNIENEPPGPREDVRKKKPTVN